MGHSLLTAVLALATLGQVDQHGHRPLFGYMMDFKTVTQGDQGGALDKDVVVARTKPQWDALRKRLMISDEADAGYFKLHGPLGDMDWNRDQVVFARGGQRPTGGYVASVYKVTQVSRGDTWRLELLVTPPKAGTMNMEVITNPYVVFRTRRTSGMPTLVVHEAKPAK